MFVFKYVLVFEYVDVMLLIVFYMEIVGIFVNIEGCIQGFNGVVKVRGELCFVWKLFCVFGNVLNFDGFVYDISEVVCDDVLGKSVEFVVGLDNGLSGVSI